MFNGAYRGRKVFITGHTGFKGTWLSVWLKSLGADVCGYSNGVPTEPSLYDATKPQLIADHRADVRDIDALSSALRQHKPDVIFHLAAQAIISTSYKDPLETVGTNIMGTANVLQAARSLADLKGVVIVTSDKCYENTGKAQGYVESDPLGGHDPYSASKGCAEIITSSFARSFEDLPPVVSARAGNVIGGGDWAKDRLIPDAARAYSQGQELVIRRPDAIRPWQHVLEPLSGYLLLGQKLLEDSQPPAGGWNFAPDPSSILTTLQVLEHLKSFMPIDIKVVPPPKALHEAHILTLDSTKAEKELQWQPVWTTHEAIEATASWYKAFIRDNACITVDQINAYAAKARALNLPWAN